MNNDQTPHGPGDQFHPDTPAPTPNTPVTNQPQTPQQPRPYSPANPVTPPTQAPTFGGDPNVGGSPVQIGPKKSRKPLFAMGGSFAIVALAAAFYFFSYLPNTPENIYRRGMASIGVGLEELIENDTLQASQATEFDGSFNMTSPTEVNATMDGSFALTGDGEFALDVKWDQYNPMLDMSYSFIDENYPKIYFRFDGVKEIVDDSFGPGSFDQIAGNRNLEGVWWLIDYKELVDQGFLTESELQEELAQAEAENSITTEDQIALTRAVIDASSTYLFTSDTDMMVLERVEDLGTEDYEGVESQKYLVQINKENLKSYLKAVRDNVHDTGVLQKLDEDVDLKEEISDEDIDTWVDDLDFSEIRMEAWVGLDNKVLRNLRFTSVNEDERDNGYVDVSLLLDGDNLDRIPLRFRIAGDDETSSGNIDVLWTTDVRANTTEFKVDANIDYKNEFESDVVFDMTLNARGLAQAPAYEIPTPSQSLIQLFNEASRDIEQVLGISTTTF